MKGLVMGMLVCLTFASANAQKWKLKEVGVGLIVQDEKYDQKLQIMEQKDQWDAKYLYENGAMAGKYKGNQLFAAWIQGPPTSEYANSYGTPVWLYKYKITYPDGKTFEAGPSGFYTPGFTYFGINTGGYTNGNWKIDWYIWNRDTQETRHVGASEFTTTWGEQKKELVTGWQVKDIGVGIYDQSQYDTVLKIVKRGDVWSQKELYDAGYFANRNLVFGTWVEGPPTNTYLNSYGTPIWNCKITITYPKGNQQEFGPYGFYTPGFYTHFINASGDVFGKWKIDYFIWNRDTQETKQISTREFEIKP